MTPLTAGSEVLTNGALLEWDGKSWTVIKIFEETYNKESGNEVVLFANKPHKLIPNEYFKEHKHRK